MSGERIVIPRDELPPEIAASIWTLEDCRARTIDYVHRVDPETGFINAISDEALDLLPARHRHSVATLLYHIAVFEMDYLYTDLLGRAEDEVRALPGMPEDLLPHFPYPILLPGHVYTPVAGEELQTHLDRLAASRAVFIAGISEMSVEEFRRPRLAEGNLITPEWVIEHLSQHEAEHRGQIWEARTAAEAQLAAGSKLS